ncbi:MAG: hypothetical protein J7K68_06320 [Candidatus Diapherotrites archaeon]|nr:hypothetical protein [Candidatus Diapherotrites archaeon]
MKNEYERYWALITNVNLLVVLGIGFIGISLFNSVLAYLYLLGSLLVVYIVLRKEICTHCYYYGKWCSTGWGKLSAMLFRKKSGNYELGAKIAGVTWPVIMGVPLIAMIYENIVGFSAYIFGLTMSYILLVLIFMVVHKKACCLCKMKNKCFGSMCR